MFHSYSWKAVVGCVHSCGPHLPRGCLLVSDSGSLREILTGVCMCVHTCVDTHGCAFPLHMHGLQQRLLSKDSWYFY